ncbi:MAG: hypothetical protein M1833_002228 [Piccolia ochrophora]|nr:MAG: hypothetical protein M1833_002228 [Piccolia ochrophora]
MSFSQFTSRLWCICLVGLLFFDDAVVASPVGLNGVAGQRQDFRNLKISSLQEAAKEWDSIHLDTSGKDLDLQGHDGRISDFEQKFSAQKPLGEDALPQPPPFLDALDVMQSHFFELWQGSWPTSIDWTAAVLGTYLSAALSSLSSSLRDLGPGDSPKDRDQTARALENVINKYFSQLTTFYFGQNAFALRMQAYDDMLWVVLGWLESIKFVNLHNSLHYPDEQEDDWNVKGWHGKQFIPTFAHRARLFYDLASHGWDTELCKGGMVWNPRLKPYKNAITNELYIAASISMYLYFPGDDNPSPFGEHSNELPPAKAHDDKYLTAATEAYDWLAGVNMTNSRGLYVDGFHISGWRRGAPPVSTMCDRRNEMVFTYNQGVLLTGQRGLWEGTGNSSFLVDGHSLVRSVIDATGWTDSQEKAEYISGNGEWAGLGRDGVLEEICDASGSCSQNGQTFKGIFFHHLTEFCLPLPAKPLIPGKTFTASPGLSQLHDASCQSYQAWIKHNARAAYETRDSNGEYGTWWGRHGKDDNDIEHMPEGAVDYTKSESATQKHDSESPLDRRKTLSPRESKGLTDSDRDVNDRGRGRTVETQGGALTVLRAAWELVERRGTEPPM